MNDIKFIRIFFILIIYVKDLYNVTSESSLILISSGVLEFIDSSIQYSKSISEWLISITTSTADIISNITIENTQNSPIWLTSTSITLIEILKLNNNFP